MGACGPRYSLTDVPISGATEAQADATRATLDAFDSWVGPNSVRLSSVRFEPAEQIRPGDLLNGGYVVAADRVELASELELAAIPAVLVHELCHAIDDQQALLQNANPVFLDALAHVAADPNLTVFDGMSAGANDRDRRSELLARLCSEFPLGVHALSEPCDGDPAWLAPVASWVTDNVWRGDLDVAVGGARLEAPVAWPLTSNPSKLMAFGSAHDDALVATLLPGDAESVWLDTLDAQPIAPFDDVTYEAVAEGYSVAPPFGAPEIVSPTVGISVLAVTEAGITLRVVLGHRLPEFDADVGTRVIAHDASGWSTLSSFCPTSAISVLVANGVLYVAWADDAALRWARVD